MGWTSQYCFGKKVTGAQIRASADAMVKTGLAAHGYEYVILDDGWQESRVTPQNCRSSTFQPDVPTDILRSTA